ncbi:MAG: cytosolic protein [Prevotella sp.]|nr:cytosolic protein [Prevotella sp.]
MNTKLIQEVSLYVKENIASFHQSRINKLETLRLGDFIKRKNPYLYKAKHLTTANDIVKSWADAYLSSAEETIFGDWLEGLAIFVCSKVYGGKKSSTTGIDLEFDKDGVRYIVSIKSGPNWANANQKKQMINNFKTAKKVLRTSRSNMNIQAVNGCCYGKDSKPDKGDYFKYCGQEFWTFISGEESLYTDIIESLATNAKEQNEAYMVEYGKMINKITKEFMANYCLEDGSIDWMKIVEINSGKY